MYFMPSDLGKDQYHGNSNDPSCSITTSTQLSPTTTSVPPTSSGSPTEGEGLDGGAIAGITVGSVAGAGLAVFLFYSYCYRDIGGAANLYGAQTQSLLKEGVNF